MAVFYSDDIIDIYAPKVSNSTSRYKTKVRLVNSKQETMIRFIRNYDLTFSDELSSVHVVSAIEAFRPDIIANEYYASTKHAWIILAANNMKTPYELKRGLKITIPSLVSLQGSRGKLVTR